MALPAITYNECVRLSVSASINVCVCARMTACLCVFVGATKMKTNFGMIADCLSFSLFGWCARDVAATDCGASVANARAHLLLPNWK